MEDPTPAITPEPKPNPPKNTSGQSDFWRFSAELIKTALFVGILVYVIRGFIVQPFIVAGSSMRPTFTDSDYLLVDKISYHFHQPRRGDVVVFKYPFDTSVNYVKRIIGLPGEKVKLVGGKVEIINAEHPNGFILDEPYVSSGNLTLPTAFGKDEFEVPQGTYFVLGDNRTASSDSREWGQLPQNDLIGDVIVKAYPLSHFSLVRAAPYQG